MQYTITHMEDYNGMQQITLDKTGNEYLVGHYNKGTKTYTHKTFDAIEDAETAFFEACKLLYPWGLQPRRPRRNVACLLINSIVNRPA